MMPDQQLELLITKTVFGGDGLASHGGKVYFVEGALPGERVLAGIVEEKKNFSRAQITRVLEPSPHRIDPPCRYVAHCGGCQYQHVEYSEELRLKSSQLLEILQGVPGIGPEVIHFPVSGGKEYGYRNSVTLHPVFSPPTSAKAAGMKKSYASTLGFIGKDNVSKIPIQNCLLLDERLSVVFGKQFLLKKETERLTFKLSDSGEVVPDTTEIFFRVRMAGETLLTNSKGFFQNNLTVASLLAEKIRRWTEKIAPDTFFDLYAGVGTFSILCAKNAGRIIAIEESAESVGALRMNREEKKIGSMEIIEGRVEKVFPGIWEKEKTPNSMALLDPPRQGISHDFANFLAKERGLRSLIYVSCDPVTLARDLKIILSLGRWKVEEVAPFDMFPRTKHLEVVVFLTAKVEVVAEGVEVAET